MVLSFHEGSCSSSLLQPQAPGQPVSPILSRCASILEPITKAMPGLLEALHLLSQVRFLSGQIDMAQSSLQHCLDRNPQFADAHLLMAQVTGRLEVLLVPRILENRRLV